MGLPPEPTDRNRHVKTRIDQHSVYARSLYLDADTLVVGDLGSLDFELHRFDALLWPETRRTTGRHGDPVLLGSDWRLHDVVVCNSGVIGFRRSPESEDLFVRWHQHFVALGLPIDQPALVHALHTTTARLYPLGARFNTTASTGRAGEDVTVLHYKRHGDRATRRLVRDVAARCLDASTLPTADLDEELAPSPSKRRQWKYVSTRNADLLRGSVAGDVRRAASAAGWL